METAKRIGILTSGGDAPGMNSAIRAIVRTAGAEGIRCIGIRRGYAGLINGDVFEMNNSTVDGISRRGGTILYTARCEEFRTEAGVQKAANTCKYLGIDAVVAIGGDGTFRGALNWPSGVYAPSASLPPLITTWAAPNTHWASTPPATPHWKPSTSSVTPDNPTSVCLW